MSPWRSPPTSARRAWFRDQPRASSIQREVAGGAVGPFAAQAAVGALILGPLVSAQSAGAAQIAPDTTDQVVTAPTEPTVKAFDCQGTTGSMGCGPGWFWRDGWRGWACYPC